MRRIGLGLACLALAASAPAAEQPDVPDEYLLLTSPRAQPHNLRFTVAVENVDQRLVVKGSIHNTRAEHVTVGLGACFAHDVRVRLYGTPERQPPAIWDSDDISAVCRMSLLVALIEPGGLISPNVLQGEISGRALPKSVPDGTYFATATIRLAEPRTTSGELAAGSIAVEHR